MQLEKNENNLANAKVMAFFILELIFSKQSL